MPKHTILFLAANPVGTDRVALDKEARAIQVELERSGFRDSFELVTRWAAEPLDLLRGLRKLRPTVVHFSGHSTSEVAGARRAAAGPYRDVVVEGRAADPAQHGLHFQSPDGQLQLVSAEALAQVFGAVGSSVRLVILNACYTEPQAAALVAYVECVVGMEGSIRDDAARNFAIGFYGGLGERASVAAAYRHGCAAISLEGLPDGDKPRLRIRDGVDAELVVLADLANSNPVARSHGSVPPPTPAYANPEVQAVSEHLGRARQRKQTLRDAGATTDEVDREILQLRRQLREGGQLRAGDALRDGRYLLVKQLGRGGFAVVWEAFDRAEQRRVAIKVLHQHLAGDPQRRERFFRGARVMMDLKHPAVVRVFDPRGEDDAFCYFVMELVATGNLRDAVLGGRVDAVCRLQLILQVGEALAEAHGKGLVHRDVKPANILLDEEGNAKLTDFDLVSAHDTTGGTRTGALGTVVYAAPECLDKPQEASARADVFGLGMTAIFCLCGHELSMSTFRSPAATIAELRCSFHVRQVLERAVAWKPEHRFADAAAMLTDLRAVLDAANGISQNPRYSCYHERCDSVRSGSDQTFTNEEVLVGCSNGHFVTGFRKLDSCEHSHCGLPHAYYCPTCKTLIDLEVAGAPPLPFVAGVNAGKSVLLAVLAGELRQHSIMSRLGIEAKDIEDGRGYRVRVVNPLWDRGELPHRGARGDYNSLVVKLCGRDWPTHVARFFDAPGEVWTCCYPIESAANDDLDRFIARQRATLSRAENVIFVADPERDDDLRGEVRHNIVDDIERLLRAADGISATQTVVESRFRTLEQELRARNYPRRLPDRAEIEVIFTRLGLPARLDRVVAALGHAWEDHHSRKSTLDDLQSYVQYVEQNGRQQRLAVVISKSDALEARFHLYRHKVDEILVGAKLRDRRDWLDRAASAIHWQSALNSIVALGRELAPDSLARYLEAKRETIPETAFFFVSALGRRPEPILFDNRSWGPPSLPFSIGEPSSGSEGNATSEPWMTRDGTGVPSLPSWCVGGLRVAEGPQGRRPSPENIWLPVLWVLSGRGV